MSATPSTYAEIYYIPPVDGSTAGPVAWVKVACSGNTVANSGGGPYDSNYLLNWLSRTGSYVGVVVSIPSGSSAEYVYKCVDGAPVGGKVSPQRPG